MNQTFTVAGMTCGSCEKTIEETLSKLTSVTHVAADREKNLVTVTADRTIAIGEVRSALKSQAKYTVGDGATSPSTLQTYRPLITVFGFVLAVSLAYQLGLEVFDPHTWMDHLMAGFFIGLSFFKFLDLKSFAQAFAGYDPLAKRLPAYGYVYPFVELALGLLFVSGVMLPIANIATIVVLGLTTVGVVGRLRTKSAFQCACLGTQFSLPLSWVTVTENVIMIAMAGVSLSLL